MAFKLQRFGDCYQDDEGNNMYYFVTLPSMFSPIFMVKKPLPVDTICSISLDPILTCGDTKVNRNRCSIDVLLKQIFFNARHTQLSSHVLYVTLTHALGYASRERPDHIILIFFTDFFYSTRARQPIVYAL